MTGVLFIIASEQLDQHHPEDANVRVFTAYVWSAFDCATEKFVQILYADKSGAATDSVS